MDPSLPTPELLQLQANWLADARARMLRIAEIARRKRVLDLGAGYGAITAELRRRTSGSVFALDRNLQAIQSCGQGVCADGIQLPFLDRTFDLIFIQNVLMWLKDPAAVIREMFRVLMSRGACVLFEPDYGGFIEYPLEVQTVQLWIAALTRAGADPNMGRKLPSLLRSAGFQVRTELLPRVVPPSMDRFKFLAELPLTPEERERLEQIRHAAKRIAIEDQVSHLPYFLIIAERN